MFILAMNLYYSLKNLVKSLFGNKIINHKIILEEMKFHGDLQIMVCGIICGQGGIKFCLVNGKLPESPYLSPIEKVWSFIKNK